MIQEQKLSLQAIILININIMIGAGLFINTTNLAHMVGAAGFLSYGILAILLYPLIKSIAMLVTLYPSGGFYAYAQPIHPFCGFISTWCYFVGKLASATILMHASVLLLQQIIPLLSTINTYCLDSIILALFLYLNLYNLKTNSSIQSSFLLLKTIPIIFVLCTGFYLFSPAQYQTTQFAWEHLADTLPFVLFAIIGFEATASLSSKIQNASQNGPRAILISYITVILINILYQFFFYGAVGNQLQDANTFLEAFPLLLKNLFGNHGSLSHLFQTIFNLAIASSALGSAYGILFSNSWNLHTLAQHKHLIYPKLFTRTNYYDIPYWCIFAEGFICLIYFITTQGSQIQLQQIAAFSCTITYSFSILALFIKKRREQQTFELIIPFFGLLNCLIFLSACIHSFMYKGTSSLITLSILIGAGIIIYLWTSKDQE